MTLNLLEGSSLTAARLKTTRHRMCYIVLKLLLTQSQLVTWKFNNSFTRLRPNKAMQILEHLITIPSGSTSLAKPPRALRRFPPLIFNLFYLIYLILPILSKMPQSVIPYLQLCILVALQLYLLGFQPILPHVR